MWVYTNAARRSRIDVNDGVPGVSMGICIACVPRADKADGATFTVAVVVFDEALEGFGHLFTSFTFAAFQTGFPEQLISVSTEQCPRCVSFCQSLQRTIRFI